MISMEVVNLAKQIIDVIGGMAMMARKKILLQQTARSRPSKKCFNCDKKGHYAGHCPGHINPNRKPENKKVKQKAKYVK